MEILKKAVSALLALVMVVTMLPVSALATETEPVETVVPDGPLAEETEIVETVPETTAPEVFVEETAEVVATDDAPASGSCGENLAWTLVDGVLTISGTGEMYTYAYSSWYGSRAAITSVIIENGVTSVGYAAFSGFKKITEITIPDSVTSIEKDAFRYCSSLNKITMGSGIVTIGSCAFSDCDTLSSITIPDSVNSVGSYAFYGCNRLSSIVIGNNVTSIGSGAFQDCGSMSSVTIPDSVTSIGDSAFKGCESLSSITIGDSVISIGDCAFERCNSLTNIMIPDSVTSIGNDAFTNSDSLTNVIIGDSVTSIGTYTFAYCDSLSSIIIGDSVSFIGSCAFRDCYSLTDVTMGDSISSIGSYAFYNCGSLSSIVIGDNVTSIGSGSFQDCGSMSSITIPDCVASIGDSAFKGCGNLKDIYFGGSESQWNAIGYEFMEGVQIHYNSTGPEEPTPIEPDETIPAEPDSEDFSKRIKQIKVSDDEDTCTANYWFEYDDNGLLVSTANLSAEDPSDTKVLYSYDEAGHLITVQPMAWIDIFPKAEYVYDEQGYLIEETHSEGSSATTYYENNSLGYPIRSYTDFDSCKDTSVFSYSDDRLSITESVTRTVNNETIGNIGYERTFDKNGRIIASICDWFGFDTIEEYYIYSYKPIVAVSNKPNSMPSRIYLSDIKGHPTWEIEYISIQEITTDEDGYISQIITTDGDVYEFIYEEVENPKEEPEPSEDEYRIEVYSIDRNLTVKPGQELQLLFSLYCNDELVPDWDGLSWGTKNNDIIKVASYDKIDTGYRLFIKGLQEGTATFNITDGNLKAAITLEIKVTNQHATPYGYNIGNVPSRNLDQPGDYGTQVNFYDFNGMYVSDYWKSDKPTNGKYTIKFNVYNRSYIHGSVDVYDANDNWIGSERIDKNQNVRGIVDTVCKGTIALTEWISGKWLSYKATTYTKETEIKIEVPEGGRFVISNNIAQSPGVFLYNAIDAYAQMLDAANDLAFTAIGSDETKIEAIQDITVEKLLESDAFYKSYQKTIVDMTINSSADALEKGYAEVTTGIVELLLEYAGDIVNAAFSSTFSIAEDMFVSMIPGEISFWFDVLFGVSKVTDMVGQGIDLSRSSDKGYIVIYTPEAGDKMTVQGVTAVPGKNALPANAKLSVSRVSTSEALGVNAEKYQLFDIGFVSDGVEVQPSGMVEIYLPVPTDYGWDNYQVLHQQSDGTWESLDSHIEGENIVVEVDSFSLFAIVEGKNEPHKLGDVNHDTKINAKDATLILQSSVGVLKETAKFCEACAEVSGDGKLNAKDSTLILQYSVNLRDTFPAGS